MSRKRFVDIDLQNQVVNKVYCSINDIMAITGLSYPVASRFAKEIVEEMEAKGEFVLSRKPYLVPTKKVLRKLGLNINDFAK